MAESLRIDGGTLRASGTSLVEAGGQVTDITPLDLEGCGSSAVVAAAASFNERSNKLVALVALQLADVGNDAIRAADSWDAQESALAVNAAGDAP